MSAVQTSNIKPYKGAEDIDPRLVEEGYDRRDQHHDVSSAVPMTSETDDVTTSRDTDPEMKNDDVKTRDNGPEMKNDDVFNTGPEMKNDDILSLRDTEPEIKGRIKEKIRGLQHIKPRLPRKSYTLAPYVNESEVLKNLMALGVELPRVEKDRVVCNFLLRCDWEKDIQPYIFYLHQLGVPDEHLGQVFSKFPSIFLREIDLLQERVQYLLDKRFTGSNIAYMWWREASIFNMTTVQLDTHLGYLQKTFKLTGTQVRSAVVRDPKLAIYNKKLVQIMKDRLEDLGFTPAQTSKFLVANPRIFRQKLGGLEYTVRYLTEEMGFTHASIADNPQSMLDTRESVLKKRHGFLKSLGRDQYDPTKENFVPWKSLVAGKDADFATKVAKVSPEDFNEFIKNI